MELNRYPENYLPRSSRRPFRRPISFPASASPPTRSAGASLLLWRHAALPARRQLQPHPGQRPEMPVHSYHRDGKMRTDGNLGATVNFNPNSDGLWDNQPDFDEPPLPVKGDAAHWDHRVDYDHWEQPGNLFRLMTPSQQRALFENTARAMGDARRHIKERHVANCLRRGRRPRPRPRGGGVRQIAGRSRGHRQMDRVTG